MKGFCCSLILLVFGNLSFIVHSQDVSQSDFLLNSIQTRFEENKGQVTGADAGQVKYTFDKGGLKLFLLKTGLTYQFTKVHFPEGQHLKFMRDHCSNGNLQTTNEEKFQTETYRMDLKLLKANENARITTEGKSSEFVNYYNHQVVDVHSYTKVTYHDIYPNIDWVIYTKNESVKYDFIVHPGGDPTCIRFESVWAEEVQLKLDGSLVLGNRMGKITEQAPVSFQGEQKIRTHFQLSNNTIGFDVDSYDKTKDLIIDPTIVWGTYYGGEVDDYASSVQVDDSGNIFISGECNSTTAIASGGYQNTLSAGSTDAFLVKFNSSGVRQWATYLGGSSLDDAYSSAIDPSGNIYICGRAYSSTGIAFAGHQNTQAGSEDGFLAKFSTTGSLVWSTYYGGSNLDQLKAVDTDALGNVFVVGFTQSSSAISTIGSHQPAYGGGFLDAFIVKFNADGIRQWATYYGGSGIDRGLTCNVDSNGDLYVGGYTESTNGISSGGFQNAYGGGGTDGYLAKFTTNGDRIWATYYGGSSDESVETCTTDPSGNVFIGGNTESTTGIAAGGFQNTITSGSQDAFLAKLNSSGLRLWGTYYGGPGTDIAYNCMTDNLGNCYLVGETSASTGIASMGIQNTYSGNNDGMIVKFDSNGNRLWGSYLGGSSYDAILGGTVDLNNTLYMCGYTNSLTGIATSGSHQPSRNTGPDAFLVKINDIAPCTPSINITSSQGSTICAGTTVDFTANITDGGTSPVYQWKKNGNNVGSNSSVFSTNSLNSGDIITCELTSNATCASPATVISSGITMTVNPIVTPTVSITSAQGAAVCSGTSVDFSATITNGGATPIYQWKKNGNNVGSNASVFTTNSLSSGDIITCELTSNATCASPATVISSGITMTVNPTVTPTVSVTSAQGQTICSGTAVDFSVTITNGGATPIYQWKKNGNNVGSNSSVFSTSSLISGDIITCELTSNATCASPATVISSGITMTVNPIVTPTVSITSAQGQTICSGTSVDFSATITNGGATPIYQWKKNGNNVGTNTSVFTTSALVSGDIITCELISNATCASPATVISSGITMTVNPIVTPTVSITSAQGQTICSGTSVDFSATITNGGATPIYQWKKNGNNVGSNASVFTTNSLNSGDIITCELTSNATCASPATVISSGITMAVNTSPNVTVSVNGITLNSDQTGIDYQWIDCNNMNQEIPGATAQTFTPTSNGNYAVVVSFGNSCADTSDCVTISTIGLNEKELDNVITVYPNPSQGNFVVESRSAITATIIDVFGKVVTNMELKEGFNQIDLSTQARGIYYIQLNSEAQQQSVKLMILH